MDADADREYDQLVRRETAQRVDRILRAMSEPPASTPWKDVYRDAHTLAGIALDVDPEVAREARRLMEMLTDARGQPRAPGPEAEAEARRLAQRISRRLGASSGGGAAARQSVGKPVGEQVGEQVGEPGREPQT